MSSEPTQEPPPRSAEGPEPRPDGYAEKAHAFPIVAIAGSAASLASIEQLVAQLRPCGMAFVIMQHQQRGHVGNLPALLSQAAELPVRAIEDDLVIACDMIYVGESHAGVRIEQRQFRVSPDVGGTRLYPIDELFRSLALDQGPDSVAVLLSGGGSDGTLGVRTIKEEGGITFVQDPETAEHPGMPRSAIESGCVDFVLAAAAIGSELMRLGSSRYSAQRRLVRRLRPEILQRLFEALKRSSGVDFSAYKPSTVERRIERRMALQRMSRPSDYARLVEENPQELSALYSDLLISVTMFFRDGDPFQTLAPTIVPALLASIRDEPIRVWVPGCATGEEAYSLAICLLEFVDEHHPGHGIQVFATDIDDAALARARQGVYPASIEADVSPERLERFFSRSDKGYQVSRQLRDLIVFAHHNLGRDPPFSRIDLISCRNVLIYLQSALQKRLMRVFHYALQPAGYLLLGAAESVGDANDLFTLHDRKYKLYAKKNGSSPGVFDFVIGQPSDGKVSVMSGPPSERKPEITVQQLADRKVLDKYAPPGVLLDEHFNIVQFRGQTASYLAPMPGAASLNVLRMVRPELLPVLKPALQRALDEGGQVSCEAVQTLDGSRRSVLMDVLPLDMGALPRCLLLLFRAYAPAADHDGARDRAQESSDADRERTQQLERELVGTKEYLETIIQELATSNEELQGTNEELQSSNEELQSTNEELETSKEELQATNEELVTVNEELHTRLSQLGVANDDLNNVFMNVTCPILLVGIDLRIRRFSTAAERLLHLIGSDVGRPVSYLGSALNAPQIEATVAEAISRMRARETRVLCSNGSWYALRTAPYQAGDRSVQGALVELVPLPARKPGDNMLELDPLVSEVLAALPGRVALLDMSFRVVWANEAFVHDFSVGPDILGSKLEGVLQRNELTKELWQQIDSAVLSGRPFHDLLVAPANGSPGVAGRWSARCIASESEQGMLTMLSVADAT